MRPFTTVTGVAVAVPRANIDTDVLIPINRLIDHAPTALGPFLFEPWRYLPDGSPDPAFALNQTRYAGAQVLVTGENFGCGSSREHAVWATAAFGFRCVIAPSFGDIFRANCFQNGVLPLTLRADEVERITAELSDAALDPTMTVDLVAQRVTTPAGRVLAFEFDPERRQALVEGLDDIGMTLKLAPVIGAFEANDADARPWNYRTTKEIVVPHLLVLAGDGVGAEVVPEAVRVVEWFLAERGLVVEVHEEPFGVRAWEERGTLMTDEMWKHIVDADAILFGAIGAPEYTHIPAEQRKVDWLLEMRQQLVLYQNLRPVRAYEPLLSASTLRPEVACADRHGDRPRAQRRRLFRREGRGITELPAGAKRDVNRCRTPTTRSPASPMIAFALAATGAQPRLCSVDKANVLETSQLWRDVVIEVARRLSRRRAEPHVCRQLPRCSWCAIPASST